MLIFGHSTNKKVQHVILKFTELSQIVLPQYDQTMKMMMQSVMILMQDQ